MRLGGCRPAWHICVKRAPVTAASPRPDARLSGVRSRQPNDRRQPRLLRERRPSLRHEKLLDRVADVEGRACAPLGESRMVRKGIPGRSRRGAHARRLCIRGPSRSPPASAHESPLTMSTALAFPSAVSGSTSSTVVLRCARVHRARSASAVECSSICPCVPRGSSSIVSGILAADAFVTVTDPREAWRCWLARLRRRPPRRW